MAIRYPMTPEILDAYPEEILELYRGLDITLLEEMCSRLRIAGELNEVTVADIKALRSHGIPLDKIKKAIAKTTDTSMEKLDALFDDVVARNQVYYTQVIDLARVTTPDRLVDAAAIEAIRRQTKGELRNITRSMGFLVNNGKTMLSPAKAYQWALDQALMQVESGAISYNQAISRAVKELAGGGLKVVDFESGIHRQIDSHARTCVMTGVNQINQKYREQSMDYLEADLVEVTAHLGARNIQGPNGWEAHSEWQGKVYRWRRYGSRRKSKYPDFESKCGYGSVTGIGGANCRHSYWPYIDGVMERSYTDKELEGMKPENRPKIEYEGKKYDDYTATQMQRRIEREVRKQERLLTGYQAAGLKDETQNTKIRLRQLRKEYKDFSAAAGLPEQRERMKALSDIQNAKQTLAYTGKSGIIKNTSSLLVGKSLGAKAKNHDVVDKQTGIIYRFVEGTRITNPTVFAGYKGAKPLNQAVVEGLVSEFGGSASKWQHAKGIGVLDVDGEEIEAEIHWFQEETVGKVKFKVKEWLYD